MSQHHSRAGPWSIPSANAAALANHLLRAEDFVEQFHAQLSQLSSPVEHALRDDSWMVETASRKPLGNSMSVVESAASLAFPTDAVI